MCMVRGGGASWPRPRDFGPNPIREFPYFKPRFDGSPRYKRGGGEVGDGPARRPAQRGLDHDRLTQSRITNQTGGSAAGGLPSLWRKQCHRPVVVIVEAESPERVNTGKTVRQIRRVEITTIPIAAQLPHRRQNVLRSFATSQRHKERDRSPGIIPFVL